MRKFKGSWGVNEAEAYATRYGVWLTACFGYRNVILESDSMFVAQSVSQRKQGQAPIHILFEDILRLSSVFSNFSSCHVKRGGNCLAHFIAREPVEVGCERVWIDPFPERFCTLAHYITI